MSLSDILPGLSGAPDIHPMLVHFPIAFWLAACAAQLIACAGRSPAAGAAARWLLFAGTVGAGASVCTGFLAANRLGHDVPGHEFVHVHRNLMLAATGLAAVACLIALVPRQRRTRKTNLLLAGALLVLVGVTTIGADRGAALVYVHGVGTPAETSQPASGRGSDHRHGNHAD